MNPLKSWSLAICWTGLISTSLSAGSGSKLSEGLSWKAQPDGRPPPLLAPKKSPANATPGRTRAGHACPTSETIGGASVYLQSTLKLSWTTVTVPLAFTVKWEVS